ncbi:hypothetical protein F4808DRAFT_460759 [Astrocystis sublimbata]|nr:hypothetical protein F4808DRAFT_460759 [Astrocystis sublimbata]
MSEPSGSVCGLGYEPHWLFRMSPIMSFFDGIHLVASCIIFYIKFGRSTRVAIAETLLDRLTGGNALREIVEMWNARQAIGGIASTAVKVGNAIPRQKYKTVRFQDIEKAREVVKHLVSRSLIAEASFNRLVTGNHGYEVANALAALRPLLPEATETEIILGQLIVAGDDAEDKEKIRRALLPYRSSVKTAIASLTNLPPSRDVAKARMKLKDLTSQTGFRWFCFGLGVLPQVIKLFGSSGIPLIQVCGALYLFPWLTFEVLIAAGRILDLDKSDSAWGAEWNNSREVLDEAYKPPDCVPQSTVAVRSIAATSIQQSNSGTHVGTTVGRPIPREHFPKPRFLSIYLGKIGLLLHIMTSIFLMGNTRPVENTQNGLTFVKSLVLAVIPVWVNDVNFSLSMPKIRRATILPLLAMSVMVSMKMAFTIALVIATGQPERLDKAKYQLIFVIASLASRIFISGFSASIRPKGLTAIRVLFCGVPPVYYFLAIYNEQGTVLFSWAEWLG